MAGLKFRSSLPKQPFLCTYFFFLLCFIGFCLWREIVLFVVFFFFLIFDDYLREHGIGQERRRGGSGRI